MPSAPLQFGNFIGGRWQPTRADASFPDENPAIRGSVVGHFHSSTAADVREAVAHAARAFPEWKAAPLGDRQRLGAQFLARLDARREELARIVCTENGKTIREARAEVASALAEGAHHVHQISTFAGHALPASIGPFTGWVRHEPLGVVAIVSPWNFPMNVMCRKALPALLTGNTVVFKPASYTPWSGVFMAQLFADAGFPVGTFNCVTGPGATIGHALLGAPEVRAISFTGSTPVGRDIQTRAALSLTRTQLELGGKNALIVMDDADLDAAVEAALVAGFACAGQWCTSTSRLLLQRRCHDRFLDALVARCEAMRIGDPLDETTDMGPVAGHAQFASITSAIDSALRDGARRLTGGLGDDSGYYITPTVLDGVSPDMPVFSHEVFGPVLSATSFDTLDEAVALANRSPYALSSSIFTRDIAAAMRYVNDIQAGLAHVNIHTGFKDPGLPFGGWKHSGYGPPENGRSGLEFFVDQKAVYIKS